VAVPALRTLGNVITGDDTQTQFAIDAGIIPALGLLLDAQHDSARKEAAWAISNITAGTATQIQAVLDGKLMDRIIYRATNDTFDIRRECIWAISNALSGANSEQVKLMISLGATQALCSILNVNDARTLAITLEGIENLLKKSKEIIALVNFINEIIGTAKYCS
jgi:hypothetical protein